MNARRRVPRGSAGRTDNLRIACAGPTGAGKTVYLASLLLAPHFHRSDTRRFRVGCDGDPNCERLLADAFKFISGDALNATAALTHYRARVDLPGSRLLHIGAQSVTLHLADPPGGDCLPASGPAHPEVTQTLARADALLLLLPADYAVLGAPLELPGRIAALGAEVGACKGLPTGEPPFRRVALVLSKAELLVHEHGRAAFRALERMTARPAIGKALGRNLLQAVESLAPAGAVGHSLVSVFGFTHGLGTIAAVPAGIGSWRLPIRDGQPNEAWRPYRVLEPVEFLARGLCWREQLVC